MSDPDKPDGLRGVDPERLRLLRHELRTPINQIVGYSELLLEVVEDEGYSGLDQDLGRINGAARQLLDHIEHCMTEMLLAPVPVAAAALAPADATGPAADEPPAPAVSAGPVEDAGERVLVVDDNELNRDMLSRRLARSGYRVALAEDGYAALRMVQDGGFDAVVLDVMMPGISGLEVLRELRTTHDVTRLPVIMATARDDSADIVEALELGANDYVTKPIDYPVVLARLETHLQLRRINQQVRELVGELERGKQFVRSVFGRYLSDAVVDSLLDRPEGLQLGGSSREVTVLMSDLRGFSPMSERLDPEDVVQLLNLYLGRMTEVIQSYGGTIDEFIGDAILVIFGAPEARVDHADAAVACALAMQLAMEEVNAANRERGLPGIEMGIGINTGPVVVGNIGSEKRTKYGVVGRHVNLAARIESYTVGGQVLASEDTVGHLRVPVESDGSALVSPKGCKDALTIYSLCAIGGERPLRLLPGGSDLAALDVPVAARLAVLDGVNVPRLDRQARLLALSPREAAFAVDDMDVPLFASMAFELDGHAAAERVFGKVSHADPEQGRIVIRFPALPEVYRPLLGGAADEA